MIVRVHDYIPASAKSPNFCAGWELGSEIKESSGWRVHAWSKIMDLCACTLSTSVPSAGRSIVKILWGYLAPCRVTWCFKVSSFFLLAETSAFSWQHGVNFPSPKLSTCFLVTWGCSQWGKLVTTLGGYGVHKNSPQGASVVWSSSPW